MYVDVWQATGKSMCVYAMLGIKYVYVCISQGVYVYMPGYRQEYVYICVYLYTCRVYVYICQESRICTCICVRLQARVCVYMLC